MFGPRSKAAGGAGSSALTYSVWKAALLLVTVFAMTGCGLFEPRQRNQRETLEQTAYFYWPYAALATDVYRTRGSTDTHTALALASPWLRERVEAIRELDERQTARNKLENLKFSSDQIYRSGLRLRCIEEERRFGLSSEDSNELPSCAAVLDAEREAREIDIARSEEPNEHSTQEPKDAADCTFSGQQQPRVPVPLVTVGPNRWEPVPELQKQTAARGWRLFVPELAIDVWRRTRSAPGSDLVLEYAIVFRGTVGGGGMISNLRGMTALLPLFWDQYRQAEVATNAIIDQVDRLHTLADTVVGNSKPTKVLYTTVGHSLGGGLAQYIYLRAPRITRVVAFDPSPIDGTSIIPIEKRAGVTIRGSRQVDLDTRDERAAIHLLYERGEFLSLVSPCHDGAVWGEEGGPHVRCDSVNFVGGSMFRQHNMAQLACHLFLAQREYAESRAGK